MKILIFICFICFFIIFTQILNRLNKIEKKIDKCKVTSKNIDLTYYLRVDKILLYFFPTSFVDENEAFDYYKNFLKKAKELGEDDKIYKDYLTLIRITTNIDLLSGNIIYWNWFNNLPVNEICFPFFSYNDIKNQELKEEIEKIYLDNYNHLNKILHGYVTKFSNGQIIVPNGLKLDNYGFNFDTFLCHYDEFCHWAMQEKIFQTPISSIIYDLEKVANSEMTEIEFIKKFDYYKNEYKLSKIEKPEYEKEKLINGGNIHIESEFLIIDLSIKHNFPIK